MNVRLYQLYDRVAGCVVGGIVRERSDESARRSFVQVLKDKESPIGQSPSDFDMLYLGEQDDVTGFVEAVHPTAVYTGRQFVREKEASRESE